MQINRLMGKFRRESKVGARVRGRAKNEVVRQAAAVQLDSLCASAELMANSAPRELPEFGYSVLKALLSVTNNPKVRPEFHLTRG